MLVLEDLCKGTLQSQNVVIEDFSEVPGRHLIQVLLHILCHRCDQVLLLSSERPLHFCTNFLPAELRKKVTAPNSLPEPDRIGNRLPVGPTISALHASIQGSNLKVGVVIDSVTSLVCTHSATAVPQIVKGLLDYKERGNKVEQVVSLIHRDVHDEAVCQVIHGRPTTLIQLQPPSSPHHCYGCVITHGELFKTPAHYVEDFNISSNFLHVVDVTSVTKKVAEVKATDVVPETQADPTADLTFNLSLKPEERAAKDQVILPYTQVSSTESHGGHIRYIPDDDDDFDDEDPDEDLDF
ncbi:elongator complex protein 5-like [Littorina saxatilis]|uniref:Elongator complex protein 5 n=1 Tax=Littorina saxatilis TaxID=31220 RepID=A0AAN9AVQ3_9CAEN